MIGVLFSSTTALAEDNDTSKKGPAPVVTNKPLTCVPVNALFKDLSETYGETPILGGMEPLSLPNGTTVGLITQIWINAKRKTFTIIQIPPSWSELSGLACVLSAGELMMVDKKTIRILLGGMLI